MTVTRELIEIWKHAAEDLDQGEVELCGCLEECIAACEALLAEKDSLRSAFRYARDEIKSLETENERLKEANRIAVKALDEIEDWSPSLSTFCQGCYGESKQIAASALAKITALEGKT